MDEKQIRYDENCKYGEDLHFVWRYLAAGDKICYYEKVLYSYLQNSGSAMSKFTDERFRALMPLRDLSVWFARYAPAFCEKYEKHGVARWMWSLAWQSAVINAGKEYRAFMRKYDVKSYMKKLKDFPDGKVRWSSRLFCLSAEAFRLAAKAAAKKRIPAPDRE